MPIETLGNKDGLMSDLSLNTNKNKRHNPGTYMIISLISVTACCLGQAISNL